MWGALEALEELQTIPEEKEGDKKDIKGPMWPHQERAKEIQDMEPDK